MSMPGYTAETSLYRARELYRAAKISDRYEGAVHLAQSAIFRVPTDLMSAHMPFVEPQCWRICLQGYCRWICF